MKSIIMLMVMVFIPLTSGMGQTTKREKRANKQTTAANDICRSFIVERVETTWTESGLVTALYGHLEKQKGCIEAPTQRARTITPRMQRSRDRMQRF